MPRQYCTEEDVLIYLPPGIKVAKTPLPGTTAPRPNYRDPNATTLGGVDISTWIDQACAIIDSALATQYDIPLLKTNNGGVVGYPYPIPTIAAILTASLIFEQRLLGNDKQQSEDSKIRTKWAMDELDDIQNGERRLIGQRTTVGDRFITGTLRPMPFNPAKDGKSKSSE